MATVYYGQAAYEGFARGFGTMLGIAPAQIKVQAGDGPAIDVSGTLYLPGMSGFQTAAEFEQTCGSIVHEMAHLRAGSHLLLRVKRERLAADCLNAVLDVADETALALKFGKIGITRPGDLLRAGNARYLTWTKGDSPKVWDWTSTNPTPIHWRVLAGGIILTRLGAMNEKACLTGRERVMVGRLRRFQIERAKERGVDMAAVLKVLARARTASAGKRKPVRTLVKLGQELEALLAAVAPPAGSQEDLMPGQQGAGGGHGGIPSIPAGGAEATEADGEGLAARAAAKSYAGQGVSQTDGEDGGDKGDGRASAETRAMCGPAVAAIAQRIAIDGDGLDREYGYARGTTVAEPYRLATDGMCMGRWQDDLPADGMSVAVLLDCSGSMEYVLPKVAGVAQAFAQEMRRCGEVKCWAFGCNVAEADDDFERPDIMGGTNTHIALRAARAWLDQRAGAKWIVVVTDGQPSDPRGTGAECGGAIADGIRVVSVGLGRYVPLEGAINVMAEDAPRLAIELHAAASLMGAAALSN